MVQRCRRIGVLVLLVALLAVPATASAQTPTPPPNPSDEELDRSRAQVGGRADEVARLSARLAELDGRTEDLQIELAQRREGAAAALVELEAAEAAAAAAQERAGAARVATEAASVAIDQARERLDAFLTATYLQGIDAGPLGLLSTADTPEDLVARAVYGDAIVREQLAAQDALERARVEKANADAAARAALDEARERAAAAVSARTAADAAFADADAAARTHAELIAAGDARGEAVRRVIDRALSQLGVQYVWGGGNGRGPSTGIPDAFGSPLDRVGFDCSGLMLYAFNGVGVPLQHAGGLRDEVRPAQRHHAHVRPGDMVFYRRGSAPIHHVALYIGEGRMVEAPYTGANVRVVPLRRTNLVPEATRVL
jgi:peptidoglycan DL-endopeptidase RipA